MCPHDSIADPERLTLLRGKHQAFERILAALFAAACLGGGYGQMAGDCSGRDPLPGHFITRRVWTIWSDRSVDVLAGRRAADRAAADTTTDRGQAAERFRVRRRGQAPRRARACRLLVEGFGHGRSRRWRHLPPDKRHMVNAANAMGHRCDDTDSEPGLKQTFQSLTSTASRGSLLDEVAESCGEGSLLALSRLFGESGGSRAGSGAQRATVNHDLHAAIARVPVGR